METGSTGSRRAENASNEPDANSSDGQSNSDRQDPWYGLKRLRSRDVKVPRDQHKLLEDHRQWMPPLTGKSNPRGHVPPDLLAQWNRIVLLRNRRTNEGERGSKSPRSQAPDSRDSPPVTLILHPKRILTAGLHFLVGLEAQTKVVLVANFQQKSTSSRQSCIRETKIQKTQFATPRRKCQS